MKSNLSKIGIAVGAMIFAYICYKYIYDGTEEYQSTIDQKFYKVRSRSSDKQMKADLLANLNNKLNIIVVNLKNDDNYNFDPTVQRLIRNWQKGVTIKEIGNMETDAAYVVNKQYMSFCLQDSPGGSSTKHTNIEDTNLMTYVAIHELAHIMSIEIGHGPEFIQNFEFLLAYAKKLKYFDPFLNKEVPLYIQLDKLNTSDNYCGVSLVNSIG
jgi:predicted metal-dependent hydrolase